MNARISILALSSVVLVFGSAARADSLEEAKQKIHDKVSSYKSIEYKAYAKSEMTMPQMSMKSTTEQFAQYVNKGDKILGRSETKISSEQKMGEQSSKTAQTVTDISDGEFAYSVTDADGTKSAAKRKAEMNKELSPFNAMGMFKLMEENFAITLMPDETVDGKSAWVFELKPKNPAQAAVMGRTLSYFDKDSGISVKSVSYDPNGKPINTSVTKDIKINSNISPDRFVFKAPPGVEVVDTTKMPK